MFTSACKGSGTGLGIVNLRKQILTTLVIIFYVYGSVYWIVIEHNVVFASLKLKLWSLKDFPRFLGWFIDIESFYGMFCGLSF